MPNNPYAQYASDSDNPYAKYDSPASPSGAQTHPWGFNLETLGRVLGLNARADLQGIASIPASLLDIPAEGYNLAADAFQGKRKGFRYNEMNQNVGDILTKLGFPQPETSGERIGVAIVQGMSGAGAVLKAGNALKTFGGPVAKAVGTMLTASPAKAVISGGTGGLAAGGAREAGLPWYAQAGAGVLGGMVPYAADMVSGLATAKSRTPAEIRAQDAGYTLPPATMDNPSTLSKFLGGWAGKIKSQQGASTANQSLTNQIAASDLGLPRDADLSTEGGGIAAARAPAIKVYDTIKNVAPVVRVDEGFRQGVMDVAGRGSELATEFPELVKNDELANLTEAMVNKDQFSTKGGIAAIQKLRQDAAANLRAADPQQNALGYAQRSIASHIEDLIDRNLAASGNAGLVEQYRAARQLFAKSYDVESATNPATGDVSAARLGMLAKQGKPLTGGLAQIGDTALAFPKAMQSPAKFGGVEPHSVLDIGAALAAIKSGNMPLMVGAIARPAARALSLSPMYQGAVAGNGVPLSFGTVIPGQFGIQSNLINGQNQ